MDTKTEASTTSRYCGFCHETRPHRGDTCTTCGTPIEHWPAGPGVDTTPHPDDLWAATALPVRAKMILEFEGTHWKYQGAKETRIRELFSVGATAYYAELGRLLDNPAALAFAPMTVKRLRRLRDQRRAQRSAGRNSG